MIGLLPPSLRELIWSNANPGTTLALLTEYNNNRKNPERNANPLSRLQALRLHLFGDRIHVDQLLEAWLTLSGSSLRFLSLRTFRIGRDTRLIVASIVSRCHHTRLQHLRFGSIGFDVDSILVMLHTLTHLQTFILSGATIRPRVVNRFSRVSSSSSSSSLSSSSVVLLPELKVLILPNLITDLLAGIQCPRLLIFEVGPPSAGSDIVRWIH